MTALPSPTAAGRLDLDGEDLKRAALTLLETRRAVYVNRARRALLLRLLAAGTATADDVRAAVQLPLGIDPRCLGPVPGPLAEAGIIARADYVRTRRPERHASIIAAWELADRPAALAWLAAHPDLPDTERSGPLSLFDHC